MTRLQKDYLFAASALIISTLPPLIFGSVFMTIRAHFHTVGIQTPIENYLGDVVFFLVVTAFLLGPWVVAIAFRLNGITDWAAVVPLLALIICWLLFQGEHPRDFDNIVSWIAFIGYSWSAIGFVGSGRQDRHWLQLIWLPPMFFLILLSSILWWLSVFME